MSDQHKQIEKLYQVLSLTLHSDGTTTLTMDAEVDGVRQVVHMAGTQQLVTEIEQLMQEIEQLRQENMALKEQLESIEQGSWEMAEKMDMQEAEDEHADGSNDNDTA